MRITLRIRALDFIERAAAALEVTIAELLGSEPNAARANPGKQSQLQRKARAGQVLPHETFPMPQPAPIFSTRQIRTMKFQPFFIEAQPSSGWQSAF